MSDFTLTLLWTCQTCGWTCECDAPGFAGDGIDHYIHPGNIKCGPISAQRAVQYTPHREAPMRLDGDAEPPAGIPADGEAGATTQQGARREGNDSTESVARG